MKFRILIALLLLPLALCAQVSVQKQQGTNALTNGSIVVPSGVSITATGNGQIIATNVAGNTVGNQVLAGNNNGGFQNVTIGSGLSFTNNTLSSTATGTVTSFSVTTNNGVVASVTNPTTTPVLNISLTGNLGSAAFTSTNAYDPAGAAAAAQAYAIQRANQTGTQPASTITGLATVATTGNYYDLTNRPTLNAGTVTSVAGTGTVNGITLTGNVTTSGNLTLGGTLSGISNSQLTNNSITITAGSGLSGGGTVALGGTVTISSTAAGGTVTSVSTNNQSGVITSVSNATTTPNITISLGNITPLSDTSVFNGSIGQTTPNAGAFNSLKTTTLTGYLYGNSTNNVTASTTIPTTSLSGTITNAQLTNNSIIIAGTSTALGGSISQDTITGLSSTGIVKRTAANTLATAVSGTDYAPATSGSSILYGNGAGGFSNVTVGSGLSFSGGTLSSTAGGGSVTSVGLAAPSGFTVSGSPVTGSGTLTFSTTLNGYLSGNGANGITASTTIPTSALSGTVSLTSQVSGTLPVANGGTGTATPATVAGNGISVSGSFPNQTITNTGVTNIVAGSNVTVNASTGSVQISATNSGGTVTSISTNNGAGVITSVSNPTTTPNISISLANIPNTALANNSITVTAGTGLSGGGTVALGGSTTLSNAGVVNLTAGTGVTLNASTGSVQISATGTGGTVTSVAGTGTVQGITLTGNVTSSGSLTLGGSLSPINLSTQVTNTLNVASGGTGVTTSSGANSVVLRDSNSNVFGNNFFKNFLSQAASGTTITLTASSSPDMVITGSGGQVIKLPDATTLPNGNIFTFNNNQSSGTITVQNNSGTTIATLQSGAFIDVVLLSNATSTGTWDYHNVAPSNASWSTNTLNWAGSYTNGTWNGNAIGALYGGTGTTGLTGYVYGNGTSAMTASTTIPTSALSGTVSNAQLANSAITIAGTSTSLGGTISQDTITGLSTTGLVKRTGANTLAIATANTDYLPATTGSAIQKANGSGGLTAAVSGTDYASATSGSSLLYGNGAGGFSNVTIGTGVSFSGGTLSATGTGGTVTSVATSGSVNGITLTGGTITSTGTITLGGTLSGITNSQLTNNSITVTAGSGLSGGGTVALGGSTTLTNAGVTSLVQGSGITLNASTGSISISANTNGTVTSVSVSGSNGIGTSITNATTTPSISLNLGAITPTSVSTGALTATGTTTLATSLTGVLKGTSGVVSTATANSDYLPATTGNSSQLLGSTGSGGLTNVSVGSGLTYSGGVLSASGGGTVTTVTTNNQSGIITLVSNPTTTPNISLSLGNITPLSDTSVFNGSIGATTPNTGVFTTLNINGYGYSTTPASTSNNTQVATTAFIVNALATQVTAINSQSAAYTLVLTDANKMIYHPSADTTARTFTIPANSSVAFPTGTIISFFNDVSAGAVTIAITSDTLVQANVGTTGSITLAAGHTASMIKVTSTRWVINVN